ncbi:MAG: hypothetical protein MZU95_10445 [Desulfomicrobium escambiense]|nr:hypothetical protein [Desulfomicrobium escambiense]
MSANERHGTKRRLPSLREKAGMRGNGSKRIGAACGPPHTPALSRRERGSRWTKCRLHAAHRVIRAFEALTKQTPGFAGGELTSDRTAGSRSNAARMSTRLAANAA